MKVYESLGSLIKDYRQWRRLSQEELATSIRLSVRALQRWEADRCRADFGNLHDFSEFTGIPMQVCVSLNVGQPVWYSLQKRRYVYSALEAEQPFHKLFENREPARDESYITNERITTEKQIAEIHVSHRDVYGVAYSMGRDVIKAACSILPDLNRIAFDRWGHYVGHFVCLPVKKDTYHRLTREELGRSFLKAEELCDIVALQEGVFLYYSLFAPTASVAYMNMISGIRHLAKVEQRTGYLVVFHSAAIEAREFFNKLGMKKVSGYGHSHELNNTANVPVMYEIELDDMMNPAKPFGVFRWMIEEFDRRPKKQNFSSQVEGSSPAALPLQQVHAAAKRSQPPPPEKPAFHDLLVVDGVFQTSCPNPKCEEHGKLQAGNIICNGHYQKKNGCISRRFLCKHCGKSFCSSSGTPFYDLRYPQEKVMIALKLLVRGMPLRGTAEVLGVKLDTVRHWLRLAAKQSEKIDPLLMQEMKVSPVKLHSLWDFVKNNTLHHRANLWKQEATASGPEGEENP